MKYELSDKEFLKIHNTVDKMIDVLKELGTMSLQLNHEHRMKMLEFQESKWIKHGLKTQGMPNQTASGMPTTVVSDYRSQGINPEDGFVPTGAAPFPVTDLTDHQLRGKEELHELVNFWMENFREEGEEQPDRNEYMQELGYDGSKAGSIISYSMRVGGLTKSLWNVFLEQGREMDAEMIRYLGGNIAQVASIHLAPLADEFEYPNPIKHLER